MVSTQNRFGFYQRLIDLGALFIWLVERDSQGRASSESDAATFFELRIFWRGAHKWCRGRLLLPTGAEQIWGGQEQSWSANLFHG